MPVCAAYEPGTIRAWKPFRGDFRIGGNPIRRVAAAAKLAANVVPRAMGKSTYRAFYRLTGSQKFSVAAARVNTVSFLPTVGDVFAFRKTFSAKDLGVSEGKYKSGRQAGDWFGATIGSLFIGGAIGGAAKAGTAASAGGGAGATGVPLASATPYAVKTGVSYGTIGTMGSGFAAGNAPLVTTVSTAAASPATKGFFTTLGEKALTTAVMGTTTAVVGSLLRPNAPAGGSAPGGAAAAEMPLLADAGGPAGGTSDDILSRFKASAAQSSPLLMVAIAATILLIAYAAMSKRRPG